MYVPLTLLLCTAFLSLHLGCSAESLKADADSSEIHASESSSSAIKNYSSPSYVSSSAIKPTNESSSSMSSIEQDHTIPSSSMSSTESSTPSSYASSSESSIHTESTPSSSSEKSSNAEIIESSESSVTFNCDPSLDITSVEKRKNGDFTAAHTDTPLTIDGCGDETIWQQSQWYDMNYIWMGSATLDSSDYHGRFKVSWDQDYLYLLVDVTDNILHGTLDDGIENYWQGDYVEVFIDFDASGGDHTFNHQAFAYHVSTEYHGIDKKTDQSTHFFDNNLKVMRTQYGNRYLWEIAIHMYDDTFNEDVDINTSATITQGHTIGFSMAYGDNDDNGEREHFIGSKESHGINNDEGWQNADVFGTMFMQ
ncbi:MAG: CBM9 family sugar-binding protein [Fibrobacterales bacterium]